MRVTEHIHNGAIIAVYRPELTEEERERRESTIERALDSFERSKNETLQQN